ncbi:MAG: hypothetical protein R2716_01225 [Microthrixaceae bacterium]
MASREFSEGISELLDIAGTRTCGDVLRASGGAARRMVADHLVLVERLSVQHLFHDGRLAEHVPLEEAVVSRATSSTPRQSSSSRSDREPSARPRTAP